MGQVKLLLGASELCFFIIGFFKERLYLIWFFYILLIPAISWAMLFQDGLAKISLDEDKLPVIGKYP